MKNLVENPWSKDQDQKQTELTHNTDDTGSKIKKLSHIGWK